MKKAFRKKLWALSVQHGAGASGHGKKGKGKADHVRMDVGGVLISLTLAVSP